MNLGKLGQRERFLLAILAILAPIGAWHYLKPVLLDFAGRGGGIGGGGGVQRRLEARREIAPLRLAALEAESGEYEPNRNIFVFGEKPKPPPPPPPPASPPAPPRPRGAAPPQRAAVPQPPPVDVSLLGIFGPERRRVAVLTDGEGAIINALERQVIHERFIVHQIGFESIDLAFVGFPNVAPQRLELGG